MENQHLDDKQVEFLKQRFEQRFEDAMDATPAETTTDREYTKAIFVMLDVLFDMFGITDVVDVYDDPDDETAIEVSAHAMWYVATQFRVPVNTVIRDVLINANDEYQTDHFRSKLYKQHNLLQ
jgi:hypothetical protein